MSKETTAILDKLYPIVADSMGKNMNKYKKCIGNFVEKRSVELYATAPYTRIYFNVSDADELFEAVGISKETIKNIIMQTDYWNDPKFKSFNAKDEVAILLLTMARYFYITKRTKDMELAITHLAFSGQMYPSIHYNSFPKVQPSEYKHVMDYVINNTLSNKYDIKQHGSVIGAVRSICKTWVDSYGYMFKEFNDEQVAYLLHQLNTRIKSFMKNIATEYYKAYEDKDKYLSYDSDSLNDDDYHIADSDSLKAERAIEKTMNYINSTGTNRSLCKSASDGNVRVDEVKSIIDTILSDSTNIPQVRELVRLIVVTYMAQSKNKDINDIAFITFSTAPKPNAKNKDILRQKEIVEGWLEESSAAYRKRKSRLATKNSYHRAIFTYFTLVIFISNK